jgi:hypothetical protein
MTEEQDQVPSTSSGITSSSRKTRSGRRFGLSDVVQVDEEEGEDLARGTMRPGGEFRRVSRGYYPSIGMLKKVHRLLFSPKSSFVMTGEFRLLLLWSSTGAGGKLVDKKN